MNYVYISHSLFGSVSKSFKPYFLDIKDDLQKANINYTIEEYLSVALFTTIITFVAENILLSFIFGLFISPITAVFLSLTLSLTISGVIFFLFYSYPTTASKSREKKINKLLPFSVSYLATLSSTRLPPIFMFKTLSRFKEYGEIAEEAKNITRNVEMFGMTFSSAIKRQTKRTSSREFKELLWGINTVMMSGGDMTGFLKQKSDELMNDYRRRIRKYSQDLSLFVEIYLTLIITGSIFFIVLSSIISALQAGVGTVTMQSFVVFIVLPLLSIGFIIVIKSISPTD